MTIADTAVLIRFLTGTDAVSYTNAQLLITVNAAYEQITGKILSETAGGKWKYGDINYSALPTYTQNLVAGTAFYAIDALTGPLIILGAEVLDNDGNGHILIPITLEDIFAQGIAVSDYLSTNGLPIEYEKREHGVVLHPAPATANVTLTAGLTIFFLRGASVITDMTATTTVGYPSPWHDFLAYKSAYTYAIAKGLPNVNFFKKESEEREKELLAFISRRGQDERPIMTNKEIVYF